MGEIDYIEPEHVSDGMSPTSRQIYKLASVALDSIGLEWPESRRDATALINQLQIAATLRKIQSS